MIMILFVLTYVGMVVPLLPDVPFLLGGFLLYHFFLAENGLSAAFWITSVIVVGLMMVIEYIATGIAVKKSGGTTLSILLGMAGLLICPILIGPPGFIIGPFLAVFVFELIKQGRLIEATKIAFSTFLGLISSILIKFMIVTVLLIWFFTKI